MNFTVNQFTTINNFKRLGEFSTIYKFGEPYEYEKISGEIQGKKIEAFICMEDDNIYKISYVK